MSDTARWVPLCAAIGLSLLAPAMAAAQGTVEVIQFNGFTEGDIVRDQYADRGVRFPADPNGGPFIDDGGGLAFLLDTPPGLLSLNPFARFGGSGQVHASVGTYVFDFVDPTNQYVPSFTDRVEVAVALIDKGQTILNAYDAGGALVASQTLEVFDFTPFFQVMSVSAPGIRRATLTTPLVQPTLGCLLDTLAFTTPAIIPARTIEIDVRPGSVRNQIRLGARTTIDVAILSSPGLEPFKLDPARILFQGALPTAARLVDRNRDRVLDLVLSFPVAGLQGLTTSSTEARLTAVDVDGTPLVGTDSVLVTQGPLPRLVTVPAPVPAPGLN